MAVSKRLRYEILRRDNHACRYCGNAAPDVRLTVDHVVPVALGGSDEPTNLVAACVDCNTGKSASAPDAPIVDDVERDALRWSAAMKRAAEIHAEHMLERDGYVNRFYWAWSKWTYGEEGLRLPIPRDYEDTILTFYDYGLPIEEIKRAIDTTMRKDRVVPDDKWKYFCGICWRTLDHVRDIASKIASSEDSEQ